MSIICTPSDHAGDRDYDTLSQSGTMITLNGVPVFWRSKKQPVTAVSSAEAEIYALYETLKEANLFHCRAQEMGIPLTYPLNVKVDSRPAMSFQKGTCVESKLRGTYDLRDKRIKELRDQGRVETDYVATKDNKADMFTKCMSTKRSDYLLRLIDNRNWAQMQPGADWITERLMMEDGNDS